MNDEATRKTWLAQIEDGSMQARDHYRGYTDAELERAVHRLTARAEKAPTTDRVVEYYMKQTADKHALQIAAKQNDDANCWINTLLKRIKTLEAELEMQRADEPVPTVVDVGYEKPRYTMAELLAQCEPAAMSDPPQSDHQGGEGATPKGPVDTVIDHLDKRLVPRSDRIRLRGALDAADTPLGGRAGADEALGRVTRWAAAKDWGR